MKKWLFVFLACVLSTFLFASDDVSDALDIQASKDHVIDQRENYFLTSTDYRITPKVNPITGEYCEDEVDLVVVGSEPLSVRRFYNHFAPYEPRYASWRYNPESFLVANFEWGAQEIFAAIGDADGSVYSLKRSQTEAYTFNFEIPKSYSAFSASGQTHPLNTKIQYWKRGDPDDKHRFQYMGMITDGSGRERSFISPMHRWTHYVHYTEKRGGFFGGSERVYRIKANTWTPYQVELEEERLPNGNIISYSYTRWKKEKRNYPRPVLLESITAYNADKSKVLGYLNFNYSRFHGEEV